MKNIAESITGIFDVSVTNGSLGQFLILIAELSIRRRLLGFNKVDLILIQTDINERGNERSLPPTSLASLKIVSAALEGVTNCYDLTSYAKEKVVATIDKKSCWPSVDEVFSKSHIYDTTVRIQESWRATGVRPNILLSEELRAKVRKYLTVKSGEAIPVAVHLKQVPGVVGASNANLDGWYKFFSDVQRLNVRFFLIGNDTNLDGFRKLKNITITRDEGWGLAGHLGIIQSCDMFIGMMSGPANIAIFGDRPYKIFKNPDHHTVEMQAELGDRDRYNFATDSQKILRDWDTTEIIRSEFEDALTSCGYLVRPK